MTATNTHETIPRIFADTIKNRGDANAVVLPQDDGTTRDISWAEYADDVLRFAAALETLGVRPGDRVVHVSTNRYEWLVADLAFHVGRAVHVPVHGTHAGEQIAAQYEHSGAMLAVVENLDVLEKFAHLLSQPTRAVVYDTTELGEVAGASVLPFRHACEEASLDRGKALLAAAIDETQPEELATILYTSGTTGEPKGVMLSQRNLATNCVATNALLDTSPDELRLNSLPFSHIYARTCDLYTWIVSGSRLAIARRRDSVIADCQIVHPNMLNGVPYFYEKVIQYLIENGLADTPGALAGVFGGKIRHCFCGGAGLPEHVARFFEKQNVSLVPGYGLTESSPVVSAARIGAYVVGTVGPPIDGVEVRIAEDGEVLTRGPHIMMGYYKNDEATREAVKDGWLYTGDFGAMDDAGNLIIKGRKKEIIVLATGKNVTPTHIEGLLTGSPLIDQAIVVGDDRKFTAALIHPDREELAKEAERRGFDLPPPEKTPDDPNVRALFEEEVAKRVATAGTWEQVRAFKLLPAPFTIEAGELTPKLSLRRNVILEHYAGLIDAMYAS